MVLKILKALIQILYEFMTNAKIIFKSISDPDDKGGFKTFQAYHPNLRNIE